MYKLLNNNDKEFIYRFVACQDLYIQDFNLDDFDKNNKEELK